MGITQLLFFSFILSAYVVHGETIMGTEVDQSPGRLVADKTVFEGEGGSYRTWSSSNTPLLTEYKLGAGILTLHPHGYALPHYTDSNRIAYVLQGSCTVYTVSSSASKGKVLMIKEGDAIPLPFGQVSSWYNAGDSDTVIVFIGKTPISGTSGEMAYFFLTGTTGILRGFSMEFLSKAYNLTQEQAQTLATNQTGSMIVKLNEGIQLPQQQNHTENYDEFASTSTTAIGYSLFEQVGLSFKHLKLGPNEVSQPTFVSDSVRVGYIIKGSGRLQVVGANGERLLESTAKPGKLGVLPPFGVEISIAGAEGMEVLAVVTSSKSVVQLSGDTSVWRASPPEVVQTSLSVNPEFAHIFLGQGVKGNGFEASKD